MDFFLLRAIRIVVRADSDPVRQALFANLRQSRLPVRLVYALHERLGPTPAALLASGYGLAAFMRIATPRRRSARILMVARHENARRQVGRVATWIGPDACSLLQAHMRALPAESARATRTFLSSPASFSKSFRIIRTLDRRHGFLVACRAAGAIAWYARSRAILRVRTPDAVLVSSDSNPEEVGFTAAARTLGVPTVFISHAYPTPFSPPLDFSLSILEGEAEAHARGRKAPIRGDVVLAGVEGESAPLDTRRFERSRPVIGIFTPKAVSWPTFKAVVADCREHFRAKRILIRWHPSMLERPQLTRVLGDVSGVVETPRTAALPDVARQCDWVVADENSGVHLPVLKLGIPTVAVRNLGLYPDSRSDLYGFARDGVVLPPVTSIRHVERGALARFFSDGWATRFEHYDASYLRSEVVIANDVRRAIWSLSREAAAKATCA